MVQKELSTTWVITIILWFFLWMLGLHRFFNWKVWTWILMIITFGWLGIWWLIDGIMIVLGKFTDAENKFVKIQVPVKENL